MHTFDSTFTRRGFALVHRCGCQFAHGQVVHTCTRHRLQAFSQRHHLSALIAGGLAAPVLWALLVLILSVDWRRLGGQG